MSFGFNVLYGLNDEGRRDFVDLLVAEGLDDVRLETSALVGVTHDAAALEIAPKEKGVPQGVAAGRFLACGFSKLARLLFGFTIGNIREVSEINICDSSVETLTENPSF